VKLIVLNDVALQTKGGAEARVAATPDTVAGYVKAGHDVSVVKGAGTKADFADSLYKDAGATISATNTAAVKSADLVLSVTGGSEKLVAAMKKGAGIMGILSPTDNPKYAAACAKAGVTAYALDYIPRISRAQAMDVLSSQSNRPATKEQVASLGAKFIAVENEEFKAAETAGGYAKQMSAEYQALQAELTATHIAKQDIVITTALIPGRKAPVLVTKTMLDNMRPGSVLIDLAVERGGNVEGAKPGEIVTTSNGVHIVGHLNWPSRMAADASNMFARNIKNFLPLVTAEDGAYAPNWEDEIIQGCALTRDGEVVHLPPGSKGVRAFQLGLALPPSRSAPSIFLAVSSLRNVCSPCIKRRHRQIR